MRKFILVSLILFFGASVCFAQWTIDKEKILTQLILWRIDMDSNLQKNAQFLSGTGITKNISDEILSVMSESEKEILLKTLSTQKIIYIDNVKSVINKNIQSGDAEKTTLTTLVK